MDILSEDGDLSEQNFADSYLFLPIHESHLNVGNTVWDALVSVPIVVAAVWATRILLKTSRKTDLVILTLGIQLLALWYLIHIIDGIVRIRNHALPGGYIFVLSTFWAVRVLSDVFIFWGVAQLHRRFQFIKYDQPRLMDGFFAVPLFLALLYVGFLFARDVSAVNSEYLATHSLARGHLALGVAYYALQFIGTLGILGESISDAHTDVLPGVTAWSKQDIFDEEAHYGHYIVGLGLLLFRSFCEVIIAGEAHRNTFDEAKFEKNHSARCALYGVISVPLVLVLANAMGVSKNDVIQDSKDQVAREVRSKLKQQLNSVTDNQVKTAPALAPILENMLIPIQNPNQGASNDNEIRRRAEVRFIRRLMGRYAGWKPIFKQDSQL